MPLLPVSLDDKYDLEKAVFSSAVFKRWYASA